MRSVIIIGLLSLLQNSTALNEIESCPESVKTFTSYEDYTQNKFVDSLCLSVKKNKFFVNSQKLVLKENGKKTKHLAGSLWGYSKGNTLFRYYDEDVFFANFGYFEVINQNGFILYAREEIISNLIIYSRFYYYSTNLTSPLKTLSLKNLQIDFPNESFIREVEASKILDDYEKKDEDVKAINAMYKKYYSENENH